MDEFKEIDALVNRESEAALARFRSGDFASRLKSRIAASPARLPPFFLFRKPVFVPALGFAVLAAAAIIYFFAAGNGNGRVEAGFRFMTETLAKTEFIRAGGLESSKDEPGESPAGRESGAFAQALFRALAGTGSGSPSEASKGGSAPLRPLFSPKERFKILYGDRTILKVLTMFANQKEA